MNPKARLTMYGQELNPESFAICKADMLIKGQDVGNIIFGNTFTEDGHPHRKFDYMLSNPPFGVEWKKVEKEVRKEAETQGYNGRCCQSASKSDPRSASKIDPPCERASAVR